MDTTVRPNTVCQTCGKCCHQNCCVNHRIDPEYIKGCSAFSGRDNCGVCGHKYTSHTHAGIVWNTVIDSTFHVDKAMKKKYEEAKSDEQGKQILLQQVKNEQQKCEGDLASLKYRIIDCIKEFEDIAMEKDYLRLTQNQIFVVQERIETAIDMQTKKQLQKLKTDLETEFNQLSILRKSQR
eukprot:TRINITY_DN112_c0_g1_i4.p2 TRINITY_DN112_c0_g1~~TRINITY_DN112_c0_g1_i4.p2  ORF type:complete len:181 (-),score=43.66 TRINITY_DN112_c0_g1_i4:134-676(-)